MPNDLELNNAWINLSFVTFGHGSSSGASLIHCGADASSVNATKIDGDVSL
jgi:hypothetical protein